MTVATTATRYEVEVDTAIAATEDALARKGQEISRTLDSLHSFVNDKTDYVKVGRSTIRQWRMSETDVMAATPPAWYASQYADRKATLATYRSEYAAIEASLDDLNAKYTGWSGFFVVPGGHIHASTHCSTCYPTTMFGWCPDISGLTEADAVAAYGPHLCSICFPSAPVEWTLKPTTDKDYCPGSDTQTNAKWNDRYQPCPTCGKYVALTPSRKIRKHVAA